MDRWDWMVESTHLTLAPPVSTSRGLIWYWSRVFSFLSRHQSTNGNFPLALIGWPGTLVFLCLGNSVGCGSSDQTVLYVKILQISSTQLFLNSMSLCGFHWHSRWGFVSLELLNILFERVLALVHREFLWPFEVIGYFNGYFYVSFNYFYKEHHWVIGSHVNYGNFMAFVVAPSKEPLWISGPLVGLSVCSSKCILLQEEVA